MELTATALLRKNLETISPTNETEWRTQRALLDMAEKQEELVTTLRRLVADIREVRTMAEKALAR